MATRKKQPTPAKPQKAKPAKALKDPTKGREESGSAKDARDPAGPQKPGRKTVTTAGSTGRPKPTPPDNTGKKLPRYDWEAPRTAYTQGLMNEDGGVHFPSIAEISEIFKIPFDTVKNKCWSERWTEDRELFQEKLRQAKADQKAQTLAQRAASFDLHGLIIAEKGFSFVMAELAKLEKAGTDVAVSRLRELMRAANDSQRIGRLALGESTDNSRLDLPRGQFTVGRTI